MQVKKFLPILLVCFFSITANAQKKWDLRTCVEYAMANNITVKLSEVQARLSGLTYKQSKLSQYPNVSVSTDGSLNSGSNQDPTSFGRITETYISARFQLQTSADIFNFYSKRNTIASNEWEMQAARANVDKLKNDIALTVANAFLQILLAKEQVNITRVQVEQTAAQLANTQKMVDAGALPPLNATQLEAQLATDSVNYLSAVGGVTQNTLVLKSYMNIDPAAPFEVDAPNLESIPLEPIADLLPDNVFTLALANQPLQRYNDLRLKAAEKTKEAARGAMYPTLSGFGSLGSGFNNQASHVTSVTQINSNVAFGTVDVGGTIYNVNPILNLPTINKTNFPTQLTDNFSQSIGLSINVPIFSGGSLRTNYEKSKLNINTLQLQKEQDNQKLKQDIYQAYNAALIAMQKFNASKKSVEAGEQTYSFATKRFDVGMLGTFDLITTQNNLLRAKLEYTINRFDYVFKMKVLEFYKGLGLKL
jgi:outer membrane protein